MRRISARLAFSGFSSGLPAATRYFTKSDSNIHGNPHPNADFHSDPYSYIHSNPQPNSDMDTSPNPNAHATTDCLDNAQRECHSYCGCRRQPCHLQERWR